MGSLAAILAGACAFVVVMGPPGIHWIALVVGLGALYGTAVQGARRGFFLTAASLMALAAPLNDAFTLTRVERSRLGRSIEAAGGDPETSLVLSIYDATGEIAGILIVISLILVLGAVILAGRAARRRHAEHGWGFYLDESDAVGGFTSSIGKLAAFLYVPMIIVIVYDVTQRKLLEVWPSITGSAWYQTFTSTKLQEAEWHMHAILFLLCFGYGYIRDAHVRIELVRERLAPRRRVWIELAGCLLFLVAYCYVVIRFGYDFAQNSFNLMEQSAAQTGLPFRFIIKSFLPLGFLVLALAGVSVAFKRLVYLFGPKSLEEASGYYAGTHHADVPQDVTKPVSAEG